MLRDGEIYFDSAATAQKPRQVIEAMQAFYENDYATVHRAIYSRSLKSTMLYESVREKVKAFINAPAVEEIIFTKGTTESLNLIASCFSRGFLKENDEVIISELEHHSNIVPWQMACEQSGAKLLVIPSLDSGDLDLDAFENMLSEKTKLVSVAHMSNVLGTIHPIETIVKMARKKGAKVVVDGAQSITQMPVDVQALGCDFYVFSSHKLFGPTGLGVLWGKKELLDAMPPYLGGGDMIEKVTFEKTTFASLPLKFEAGTPPIAEVIGLGASLDYLNALGMEAIHDWDKTLQKRAMEHLEQIEGLTIFGSPKRRGGIISFKVDGIHHLDLGTFLNLKGIQVRTGHLCAQPAMRRFGVEGMTRASFAFYNTLQEVDHFAKTLQEVICKLV